MAFSYLISPYIVRVPGTAFWKPLQLQLICFPKPVMHRYFFSLRQTQMFHPQHENDRVPKKYELIYENSQRNIIGPSRLVMTAVGLLSAGMSFGYLFNNTDSLEPGFTYAALGVGLLSIFVVAFVNVISRYYLIRIYFCNENKRLLGIQRGFAGQLKHLNYTMADLKPIKPSSKATSLHIKSNIHIKGGTFHIRCNDFVLPKYYNMHLGYQQ